MKYLKYIKENKFENDFYQTLKDICLELNDCGFETKIFEWNHYITIFKPGGKKFKYSEISIALSLDKKLSTLITENITNRSKYIEWLIYQDLKKNKINGIEKIII